MPVPRNTDLGVGSDGARDADGIGAEVGVNDDFDTVFGAKKLDDVGDGDARFKGVQARGDRGGLKFAAELFRHSGGLGETADRATDRRSESWVGINAQNDSLGVSCHETPLG
jgi:hypothetical protein